MKETFAQMFYAPRYSPSASCVHAMDNYSLSLKRVDSGGFSSSDAYAPHTEFPVTILLYTRAHYI